VRYLPFIPNGNLADHILRKAGTVHRMRDADPGLNQAAQDTVDGEGSSDSERDNDDH
jgi:hypothetical protein